MRYADDINLVDFRELEVLAKEGRFILLNPEDKMLEFLYK